jgi:predicted molibdopterin-dependent oxidoreductase YjgC
MAPDIFEPYDRLIEIECLGRKLLVPENNSILRCLQFVYMESISEAELCWNGDCMSCLVEVEDQGTGRSVIACRTRVRPGLKICSLSGELAQAIPEK